MLQIVLRKSIEKRIKVKSIEKEYLTRQSQNYIQVRLHPSTKMYKSIEDVLKAPTLTTPGHFISDVKVAIEKLEL